MYLVPIAWLYVTLMMAIVEATSSNGTVLGALVTFVLYGLLPVALVMYLLRTPGRRRAQRAREKAGAAAGDSIEPDAGRHAPAATENAVVAPVREKS
ncbi:MAG TPA: hypothetical protein PLJ46_00270 [Burkholderiaceae bacterium]|nr:hypothetical protein [Burkholderiaceae bacterium]